VIGVSIWRKNNYSEGELALIVLDSVLGFEYKHKIKLTSLVGDCGELLDCPKIVRDYLFEALGEAKARTIVSALTEDDYHDFVLKGLEKAGTVCLTLNDPDYPSLLKETDIPPVVLYCNGNIDLLKEKYPFSIVGSRKCLPYATALAKDFSETLSKSGATIVTGSAGGADKAAIDGAIDSGKLICVLAGGINHVFPNTTNR
ncbi:MAG: DNA-processing protein DprA, partial [Clostridia bacterium]|nr:DNA-processing protein DprA [Clostridia bacterium]